MATYSNIGIKLITTGDESGTWGDSTNSNFSDVLDEAIAGAVTYNISSDADFTLTVSDGTSSDARHAVIKFTSTTLSATRTCTFAPNDLQKTWVVINATTGGQSLTFKQGSAGGTVTVANGESAIIYSDGAGATNGAITRVLDSFTNTKITTGTLNATTLDLTNLEVTNIKAKDGTAAMTVADSTGVVSFSANPTLSGGTANGVLYLNGSKVATSGSGLTYNGSTLATTGALTVDGNATLGNASSDAVTVSGYMGVGGAGNAGQGLRLTSNALTGTSQYGAFLVPVGTSSGTTAVYGLAIAAGTAASAYTANLVRQIYTGDAVKGAGSTITSLQGIYVDDLTAGTNNYGITSAVSSGANKWNIYASGTADNYFAGNVGIGTTSPVGILDVVSSGSGVVRMRSSTGTGTVGFQAQNSDTGTTTLDGTFFGIDASEQGYVYNYENAPLIFGTNSAERLRITSAGSVGIGTSSPAAKLDIVDGVFSVTNTATSVDNTVRNLTATGTTGETAGISFDVANNANGVRIYAQRDGTYGSAGTRIASFRVATTTGGVESEKFAITGEGNVGIGTSSPSYKLDVNGLARITPASGYNLLHQTSASRYRLNFLNDAGSTNIDATLRAASFFFQDNAGSTILNLDSSGNVGIGTSSPSNRLHVVPSSGSVVAQFEGATSGQSAYLFAGSSTQGVSNSDGTYGWFIDAAGTNLRAYTNNTERLRITSAGDVGIGTTNPQGRLDLGDGTSAKAITWGGSTGTAQYSTIWTEYSSGSLILGAGVEGNTSAANFLYSYTGTIGTSAIELDSFGSDGIKFYTDSAAARTAGTVATMSERMRISQSGNVGIGTASPSTILHVNKATGATLVRAEVASGSEVGFDMVKTGATTQHWRLADGVTTNGNVELYDVTNSRSVMKAGSGAVVFNETGADIDFRVESDTNTHAFFVQGSDGNVGIGTSSPSSRLTVVGNSGFLTLDVNGPSSAAGRFGTTSGSDYVEIGTDSLVIGAETYISSNKTLRISATTAQSWHVGGSERMRLNSSGNLGIGTSSPAVKLDVAGDFNIDRSATNATVTATLKTSKSGASSKNIINFYNTALDAGDPMAAIEQYDDGTNVNGSLLFKTNGAGTSATRMTIDQSGNVGIGTVSPDVRLQVTHDNAETSQFNIGASILYLTNTNTTNNNWSQIWFTDSDAGPCAATFGAEYTDHTNNYANLSFATRGSSGLAERMRITSAGQLLVGKTTTTANGGVVQVSNGVTFPATQVACSDANTLDDYEEGAWTPVVADAATGGNASATVLYGNYTKIGNIVTVTAACVNINTSGLTAGNVAYIRGLPFASADIASATGYFTGSAFTSAVTISAPPTVVLGDNGQTALNLNDGSAILVSDLTSGSADIWFTLTYQA